MSLLLVIAAGAGAVILVGAPIVAAVAWGLDRQTRRTRPSVRLGGSAIQLPPRRAAFALPLARPVAIGRAAVVARPRLTLPALAILVDFIAREAAIQRTLAYELTSAPIWSSVDGVFTAKGLRTA